MIIVTAQRAGLVNSLGVVINIIIVKSKAYGINYQTFSFITLSFGGVYN